MACVKGRVSLDAAPMRRATRASTHRSGAGARWVVLLVVAALLLLTVYGLGFPSL